MQRDTIVKGKTLGNSSELSLLAPIQAGFVDSLESMTYKTRIKKVLETLHGARTASHEQHTARLLSDSVERVGVIHSVRVAVLEPEDKVLLVVTFDGNWESYIRVLWDKVGTLLDLIFIGTVDYVTSHGHSFDEWREWAHRVQVESAFFYGPPDSTMRDAVYYRRVEHMRARRGADEAVLVSELNELRAASPSAEEVVRRLTVNRSTDLRPDDPQIAQISDPLMVHERVRNGLRGLAALYRLTELHRPGTHDGDVLWRAAVDLLLEFVQLRDVGLATDQLNKARSRFNRELTWLFPKEQGQPTIEPRATPELPLPEQPVADDVLADVQGGVLRPYAGITHGVALMLAFKAPGAAKEFIDWVAPRLTRGNDSHQAGPQTSFVNVTWTFAGLRACGLSEDELELFPEEFRQGMAARAGLLGDVRNNHPRYWRLPRRFAMWGMPAMPLDATPGSEIEIDGIHAVLILRCQAQNAAALATTDVFEEDHPLRGFIEEFRKVNPRLSLLAIQPLNRYYRDGRIQEHFGYADGDGQPQIEPAEHPFERNRAHLGEVVLGHPNAADFNPSPASGKCPYAAAHASVTAPPLAWTRNSSFLVMRKYRQFVHRLEQAVDEALKQSGVELPKGTDGTDTPTEQVYAKLMGRFRSGRPVVKQHAAINNFLYDKDPGGRECPLNAHVRLSNPRFMPGSMARPPRLMRRSMSYGRRHVPGTDDDADERGLFFMAYVSSIAEQYEVVQRWLTHGNATGVSTLRGCPIVGVPENGVARHFAFETVDKDGQDRVFRMALEKDPVLFQKPQVVAQLEWGAYSLAPSLSALKWLGALAAGVDGQAPLREPPWQLQKGRELVAELRRREAVEGKRVAAQAWKAALEDPEAIDRLHSAAIWAAVRADHDGVLKTPYGTLVASRDVLAQVLNDPDQRYSIRGQFKRMKKSFGEIYLGLDAGPRYVEESTAINRAITTLTASPKGEEDVFVLAFEAATNKIDAILEEARQRSVEVEETRYEVSFDAREVIDEVLAVLCDEWFGLKDSGFFDKGGPDLAWKGGKPLYPGHFMALSRYMFQPNPGAAPEELSRMYGGALKAAMREFVSAQRRQPKGLQAPIAAAIFGHSTRGGDDKWVASTMVGVMMGFIAPIVGAVSNVLREWLHEGRFGLLRAELAGRTGYADAAGVLLEPMLAAGRMRPMPQLIWRTAKKAHPLGADGKHRVNVKSGDKIILALVSGTQESLVDGAFDGRLMFGGVRREPGTPHPTHACPGHKAGLAAMLGTLTALLARFELMRPVQGTLSFIVEGDVEKASSTPAPALPEGDGGPVDNVLKFAKGEAMSEMKSLEALTALGGEEDGGGHIAAVANPPLPKRAPDSQGLVLAWGDSWLDYQYLFALGKDLRDWLVDFGYTVPADFCAWQRWKLAAWMASTTGPFCDFIRDEVQVSPKPPRAILLSAGGNDCTGDKLRAVLKSFKGAPVPPSASKPGELFLPSPLKALLDDLEASYKKMIMDIQERLSKLNISSVPILIHGYDYPFPEGRTYAGWLRAPFDDAGYQRVRDRDAANAAMRYLIEQFNLRLAGLAASGVIYVKLTGTLEAQWPAPDTLQAWANDLHPTDDGFAALATVLDTALQKVKQP